VTFIHLTGSVSFEALRPKIGMKTKFDANACSRVDFAHIMTGRETLMIDFPLRILTPIFFIIHETTLPCLQITSKSQYTKQSLGSYSHPQSDKLLSHSSFSYFYPF